MTAQSSQPTPMPQRPATDDRDAWRAYWQAQGMSWRTEREVDTERQAYLAERQAVKPDIVKGIYPFKDIRLTRADVEWLLATHESGGVRGPVRWSDEREKTEIEWRAGLDLRGADLRGGRLLGLPLARMRGALTIDEWVHATAEQQRMAAAHLEGANLLGAHLEEASLRGAHLERALLWRVHLERAHLGSAHLEGARLGDEYQEDLGEVALGGAHLEGALLDLAHLEGANLTGAYLEGADLRGAHLEGKRMPPDDVQRPRQWARDYPEVLLPADLRGAFLSPATSLRGITLGDAELGFVPVADVHWGGVNLAVTELVRSTRTLLGQRRQAIVLGDEREARQREGNGGKAKDKTRRLREYAAAVRANRQLATTLRDQGLNEIADTFGYRAQVLQRQVLRRQRQWGPWLFSWFLWWASGYGFRLGRILSSYLGAVGLFAVLYLIAGALRGSPEHRYAWYQAVLVSVTNIHGRIFTGLFVLDTVQAWLAAAEAVVGLVIEGVFVAMLVQRFFAR